MRQIIGGLLAGGMVVAAMPSQAATGNVIFNGSVVSSCLLVVGGTGTMTQSGDLTSLSSRNPAGSAGTVTLTTTGGVTLGVDTTVVTNTRPTDDTGTIVWAPTYLTSGAHNLTERSASSPLAGPGIDTVSVHLSGTKSGGGVFASGAYQATVTVRCE